LRPPSVLPVAVLLIAFFIAAGCRSEAPGVARKRSDGQAVSARPTRPKVVVLGDSLTAGLGLPADQAYPALLQSRIDEADLRFEVVNAGVSGDTTAGGLRRLDWVLTPDTRVLIVALGANDGLRGIPVSEMKRNLSTIVSTARNRGVAVLLAGMEAPPNFGREYTTAFRQAFRDVAREQGVPLLPFLLQGVAGDQALNQGDGIHPNAEGARRIADLVWRELQPMLVHT
jgi:acyl-CoA thioesterase-1